MIFCNFSKTELQDPLKMADTLKRVGVRNVVQNILDQFSSNPHTRNTNIGSTLIRQSKFYIQPPSQHIPRIVITKL